jgi:predicted DNA-binding transcriptional regulator AlpA
MTGKPEAGTLRRYGRAARVAEMLDVSVSTIWRWRTEGVIPPPHHIGPRTPVWDLDEVQALVERRRNHGAAGS